MNIIWQYLDKRSAAVNALKDYSSMAYILAHTDEEITQVHEDTTTLGSPAFTDMPGGSPNPQSGEMRIITAIDEIDVLRERYRQAKEYMEWFQPAWNSSIGRKKMPLMLFPQSAIVFTLSGVLHTNVKTVRFPS